MPIADALVQPRRHLPDKEEQKQQHKADEYHIQKQGVFGRVGGQSHVAQPHTSRGQEEYCDPTEHVSIFGSQANRMLNIR